MSRTETVVVKVDYDGRMTLKDLRLFVREATGLPDGVPVELQGSSISARHESQALPALQPRAEAW